jgi:hypothetical protein
MISDSLQRFGGRTGFKSTKSWFAKNPEYLAARKPVDRIEWLALFSPNAMRQRVPICWRTGVITETAALAVRTTNEAARQIFGA